MKGEMIYILHVNGVYDYEKMDIKLRAFDTLESAKCAMKADLKDFCVEMKTLGIDFNTCEYECSCSLCDTYDEDRFMCEWCIYAREIE